MTKHLLTLVLAASVTAVGLAQTQAAKPAAAPATAQALIQGTWVLTTANGEDLMGAPELVVTITGDKYIQTQAGAEVERGSFKIDETKKPMTLDLAITGGDSAGKTQLGVIEVTETTMRGNLNQPGESARPKDFTPVDGFFAFTAKKRSS